MAVVERRDLNPPHLHPAYEATASRAPATRLIEVLRGWLHHPASPVWGRVPLRPTDNDPTGQHAGRPIGQTITLKGRVLDSDGRCVPNTLVEIWQTNASGARLDPADPGLVPLDPNIAAAAGTTTDSQGRHSFARSNWPSIQATSARCSGRPELPKTRNDLAISRAPVSGPMLGCNCRIGGAVLTVERYRGGDRCSS
jgi:protocatechuate 3,4-dioxygenase beta subunit